MMHARHLVRRLLELRRGRSDLFALGLNGVGDAGQGLMGQTQPGGNPDLGFIATIDNVGPQGNGVVAIDQNSDFNNRFTDHGQQTNGLGEQHGFAIDYNSLAGQSGALVQSFDIGQSGLPQQKFDLGQQGDLSGQSLTVSGFWVPFKRRVAS